MTMTDKRLIRWASVILAGGLMLSGVGCTPVVENRGHLPTEEMLEKVQPGLQTRESVQTLLGTPSSFSVFGEEIWYYISSKEKNFAFYAPEELERKVIAIHFDPAGMVREIKAYGLEDGRAIEPVARVTPTAGSEMSLLQQLLGNLGRFNKSKQHTK